MGNRCAICNHLEREAIDEAILSGESYVALTDRYGLGKNTCSWHGRMHLKLFRQPGFAGKCRVCDHPRRLEIDEEIRSRSASIASIARRYSIAISTMNHHVNVHLGLYVGGVRCTVCKHESLDAINSLLRSGEVLRTIGKSFRIGAHNLGNHRLKCLGMEPIGTGSRCAACRHPERAEIDKALFSGQTHKSIGLRYGLTTTIIAAHNQKHVKPALAVGKDEVHKKLQEAKAKHAEFRPRGVQSILVARSDSEEFGHRLKREKEAEVAAAKLLVKERDNARLAARKLLQEADIEYGKAELILARVHREQNELIIRLGAVAS